MAYENLELFTEQDANNRFLQVSNKNITNGLRYNDFDHCVYRSYGVGHFDDFIHLFDAEVTVAGNSSFQGLWAITNILGDVRTDHFYGGGGPECYCDFHKSGAGTLFMAVGYLTIGSWVEDTYICNLNTVYYGTVERNDTTLTLKIYSDALRTNLLDTLTIACITDAMEYLMCAQAYGWAGAGSQTGYVEKIDLSGIPPPPSGAGMQPMNYWGP